MWKIYSIFIHILNTRLRVLFVCFQPEGVVKDVCDGLVKWSWSSHIHLKQSINSDTAARKHGVKGPAYVGHRTLVANWPNQKKITKSLKLSKKVKDHFTRTSPLVWLIPTVKNLFHTNRRETESCLLFSFNQIS